jgi:hypothetical protein
LSLLPIIMVNRAERRAKVREQFRRVLRRAECLFALIAIRHARVLDDRDEGRHGRAMVGRDQRCASMRRASSRLED